MSASASVEIPLTFDTTLAHLEAKRVLNQTAGISEVLSTPEGNALIRYEFPGNMDNIVRRLKDVGARVGPTVHVSIPVKNLSGRVVDPTTFLATLGRSPAVTNPGYDGNTVTATLVSQTNAFRYVYEEIIMNGLMPLDVPTIAHPQEFVL